MWSTAKQGAFARLVQTKAKPDSPPPPDPGWRSGREGDNTFSFILRVWLDRASGGGPSRPVFRLEDVGAGREWRFTEFKSAAECLALRVQDIVHGPDLK